MYRTALKCLVIVGALLIPAGLLAQSPLYGATAGGQGNYGVKGCTYYGFGVCTSTAGDDGSAAGYLGYTTPSNSIYGVYSTGNIAATGTKSFVEPHPTDASKVVRYVSLEGPEAGTYFRGTGQTVRGRFVIEVPEDFRIVTDAKQLTVQLTPVGQFASLMVRQESLDRIVVESSRDVKFHYQVNGVRKAFRDYQPITKGTEFVPRSASAKIPGWLPSEVRARLVANGTYREDGSVNLQTAERLGWLRLWTPESSAVAGLIR
jgi:hypothetical protein